jgi:secreted PhoX family phosphatase
MIEIRRLLPVSGATSHSGRSEMTCRYRCGNACAHPALDTLIVPNGYDHAVVVKCGDRVLPGAAEFDVNAQTAQRQAEQFGYNNGAGRWIPLVSRQQVLCRRNDRGRGAHLHPAGRRRGRRDQDEPAGRW